MYTFLYNLNRKPLCDRMATSETKHQILIIPNYFNMHERSNLKRKELFTPLGIYDRSGNKKKVL